MTLAASAFRSIALLFALFYVLVGSYDGIVHASPSGGALKRQFDLNSDVFCSEAFCISATVEGKTTKYLLQSTRRHPIGWMAIGFGHSMADSPMVIMWPTRNGSVTLSQRTAPYETEPKVDPNPPRIATLDHEATSLQGTKPSMAFTMPYESDEDIQDIIWAFSKTRPESARIDGHIPRHNKFGRAQLKLIRTDAEPVAETETDAAVEESSSSDGVPFMPYQKTIVVHAIFSIAGFLVLLPFGSLLARYLRAFYPSWITLHWVVQAPAAGSVVLLGILAGFKAVDKSNATHFDDAHKRWGVFLVALYITQCIAGIVIHRVWPSKSTAGRFHAAFGLSVIALSFYQVHVGYKHEWTSVTGRTELKAIEPLWWTLLFALPLLYIGGLFVVSRDKKVQLNLSKTADEDLAMEERRPLRTDEDDEIDSAQLEPHKP